MLEELEKQFIQASRLICSDAPFDDIKELIDNNPEIAKLFFIDKDKSSLLYYAVTHQNLPVVRLLLKHNSLIEPEGDLTDIVTPLIQSFRANTTAITMLLLEQGARIDYTYENVYPLQFAVVFGFVDVVTVLLDRPEIDINCKTPSWGTPLSLAVSGEHFALTRLLLERNADINCSINADDDTLLHMMAKRKQSTEMVTLILQTQGIQLDVLNKHLKTPLFIAALLKNHTMAELLVAYGANPYYSASKGYSPMWTAVDNNDKKLLDIFFSSQSTMRELYQLILKKQMQDFVALFKSSYIFLSKHNMEILFIISIYNKQFAIANSTYQEREGLSNSFFSGEIIPDNTILGRVVFSESLFVFPENTPIIKQQAFIRFCADMTQFMANTQLCLSLLSDLDAEIASKQQLLEVDFSKFMPGRGICYNGFKWPSACDDHRELVSSDGLLRYLIRKQLNKHGIDTQDTLYQFTGFVKSNIADALIANGVLFKEQFLMGNALFHGLYSHYLQWYLISKAIDKGIICLPDTIILQDMLTIIVSTTYNKKSSWGLLLDYIMPENMPQKFSSPHGLNTLLLNTEKLPFLRGYLLNSFYKNIKKLQDLIEKNTGGFISYETIIIGQSIAGNVFNRFDSGITRKIVADYYRDIAKTKGTLDEGTGILTKSSSERFIRWNEDINSNVLRHQSGLFSVAVTIDNPQTVESGNAIPANIGL